MEKMRTIFQARREQATASITVHWIANGKLVEKSSEKDTISLLAQIGVMCFATVGVIAKKVELWSALASTSR